MVLSREYWIESTGLGLTMFLTVSLGGLVGVIVVAQTLYASTTEHLGEFATVKAIGGGKLTSLWRSWPNRRRLRPPWATVWPWP